MWHKRVRWHHFESDILKEGPGRWGIEEHPGRWGIVEHQKLSIKVLFKTNAKSHKHPGIKLLSSESKTQLVNQRKHNSPRRACIFIYIYILTQSFWTGTKVIRWKHVSYYWNGFSEIWTRLKVDIQFQRWNNEIIIELHHKSSILVDSRWTLSNWQSCD